MKRNHISRRNFFYGSLLAGAVPLAGFGSSPSLKQLGYKSPNERMNIASIGAGGKATSDIQACAETENIVALCDVDERRAEKIYGLYPKVPKYKDYRVMLEKERDNIDGVIVTIPDHMHTAAALAAMELGKHVYVQKPLAHTVWECRELQKAADKYKVATQMGNQGYSNEGTRQCAEMIWSGSDRRCHRGTCLDQSSGLAPGHQGDADSWTYSQHSGLGFVARHCKRTSVQR